MEEFWLNKKIRKGEALLFFWFFKNCKLIRDSSSWRSNLIPSVRDSIVIIGSRSVTYTFGSRFTYERWVRVLSKICILAFLGNYSNTVCWVSKRVDWGSHHLQYLEGARELQSESDCVFQVARDTSNREKILLWHCRLGRPSFSHLEHLFPQ